MKKISWFTAWHVLALTTTVTAMLHPDCDIASEIRRAKKECLRRIREIGNSSVSGCNMTWENALCWPSAEHGETVSVSCPPVFLHFSPVLGMFWRNCTSEGWSEATPSGMASCILNETSHAEEVSPFFTKRTTFSTQLKNWSARRKPGQSQGERANSTHRSEVRIEPLALRLQVYQLCHCATPPLPSCLNHIRITIRDVKFHYFSNPVALTYLDITVDFKDTMWKKALRPTESMPTSDHPVVWYFITIQTIYTVGYSLSLIVLSIAVVILLIFRNLHCNRNYIHIQLFISFILRSLSVMIKDAVLFGNANTDHCDLSTVGCKVAVVFCYFSTMTNYFWLLVEALYLNLLLLVTFSYDRGYMWWWSLLGWGVPTVCTAAWVVTKLQFENTECWDVIEDSPYWWIVKGPIVASVAINLVLFVNIVRILVQKLIPRDLHLANSVQYRRLMKSTMLLVPLFGIHYIVCAFPPNGAVLAIKLYLELCIGSFQGLTVGILYCFMNQEVSGSNVLTNLLSSR
ncbi:growth hormone-releasing hormone receptor-like [Leucoraja erinacea]|uniref:growth hormone-releasing hormone receptor-like n=1 Tax=Leucoraja erinaceus TaxID=7782 RepID=UPI002458DBEB|nr:growth hormone-releasing hormone receptor-like [Leucoraja erinacea]